MTKTTSDHATFACEICGEEYPSLRAAWLCEDADLEEARNERRR